MYCGIEAPQGDDWKQDPDTLDTWFSSGLWTFSTLGWPEETEDLKTYHPTTLIETGYDILFFWIARMILMSGYLLGDIPFKTIYLHGLVRDEKGQKMSKSIGNIIDPLDMTKKYGADAARLSLIIGATPGNDVKLSEDKIRGFKHFANKLWNISRFVLSNTESASSNTTFDGWSEADAKLRTERDELLLDVTKDMEAYRLYLAAEKLYHYAWDTFAAEILEESKQIFKEDDEQAVESRKQFLYETLLILLRGLHPFMPFVTEEIWQSLPQKESAILMVARWPAH